MEMKTCNFCGKIFGASEEPVCQSCKKKIEQVYEQARRYLRDNPQAVLTAEELAKAIDAPPQIIRYLKQEGRFEESDENTPESLNNKKRQELITQLQKSLGDQQENTQGKPSKHGNASVSYTVERYKRS